MKKKYTIQEYNYWKENLINKFGVLFYYCFLVSLIQLSIHFQILIFENLCLQNHVVQKSESKIIEMISYRPSWLCVILINLLNTFIIWPFYEMSRIIQVEQQSSKKQSNENKDTNWYFKIFIYLIWYTLYIYILFTTFVGFYLVHSAIDPFSVNIFCFFTAKVILHL